ncbi:MAG: UDP-N-acetylmuramate--L-alanine ligase [Caldilineales bacterium]|nr:UDP-N-acetylmuramate--L-alanine ligase [Caldilineales bacterium]
MNWQELFSLPPNQRSERRFHLIGIGGTGLGPIAKVLLEMGFQVSGSDQTPSPRTEILAGLGAIIHIGHKPEHLRHADTAPMMPDVVLISSAVASENPEVQAARAAEIPVVKRNDFLGPLTQGRRVIAVAGTHGKTTTTGMIAHILSQSGRSPGYIIGSSIPGLGMSAAGDSPYFVIEADEYDYAFLGLSPDLIVLTSLEWDHPDCFLTAEDYIDAFRQFVERLRPKGRVIFCQDDAELRSLAAEMGDASWLGYGSRANAAWQAKHIDIRAGTTTYTLEAPNGIVQQVRLQVIGLHNVLNSAGALLAGHALGVSVQETAPLLAGYRGAERRFEIKGEAVGVMVVDDYAHHPTEVRTTLAAARAAYPNREIWAVYQPHTYSRTRTFLDQFEGVFSPADRVFITDIYAAREAVDPAILPEMVAAASRHEHVETPGSLPAVLDSLSQAESGTLVVILSAGTATQLGDALLERLTRRELSAA